MRRAAGAVIVQRELAVALLAYMLVACSPRLDWREARPEGSRATLLLPCRPASNERAVPLAGAPVRMRLHSCSAAGATFSFAVIDAGSAERVTPLLAALKAHAAANVSGRSLPLPLPSLAGSTPNAESARVKIDGTLPDGRPVVEHVAFFVKGTILYQAAVIAAGTPVGPDALDTFFTSIHLR